MEFRNFVSLIKITILLGTMIISSKYEGESVNRSQMEVKQL
jgi:hypothetical protein